MNTKLSRQLSRLSLFGAALFLGACMTNEDDTGIDPAFKNAKVDARTAGQSLVANLRLAGDWNAATAQPAGGKALIDISTKMGGLKQQASLAKMSAAAADTGLQVDTSTISKGYVTVSITTHPLLMTVHDTAVVKWDDKAQDTIKDNENIISFKRVQIHSLGGKIETAEFVDGDGDGLVNARPGIDNKVKLALTVADNGYVEKTDITVSAGPDADFDAEGDNRILQAEWKKYRGAALVAVGAYLDGDGDGIVLDNGKTCVVLAKFTEMEPKDRPLVKRVDAEAKVRVFANKAGDEPVGFSYEEELFTGRVNSVTLKNSRGGADIIKGDTMTVTLETKLTAGNDTLKYCRIDFVMNPGQDLKSEADDSLYAVHIVSEKRFGLERSAEFHFVSDKPVPHGQEAAAGTFSGKATYANGKSASLKGSFSPTSFKAEYTGPDGVTVKVEYSLGGLLLSGG